MKWGSLFILIAVLGGQSSRAITLDESSAITYGTEFNFSNHALQSEYYKRTRELGDDGIRAAEAEFKAVEEYKKSVEAICQAKKLDCIFTDGIDDYKNKIYEVKLPDGFRFEITADPGCVEIKTFPATAKQIQTHSKMMEDLVFQAATKTGLNTEKMAAHFNIGIKSAFQNDPELYARFMADISNRPALALGVLGKDVDNAPPMSFLRKEDQEEFIRYLKDVESKKLTSLHSQITRLNNQVFTYTPHPTARGGIGENKFQAISVKAWDEFSSTSPKDFPMEMRFIRQPKTAKEYALLADLMDRRIQHLKTLKGTPIRYQIRSPDLLRKLESDPLVQAVHFQIFTHEMGEPFGKYLSLVDPKLKEVLLTGVPSKILSGDIDWKDHKQVEAFRAAMVDDFGTSEWLEKKSAEALSHPSIPHELKVEFEAQIEQIKALRLAEKIPKKSFSRSFKQCLGFVFGIQR